MAVLQNPQFKTNQGATCGWYDQGMNRVRVVQASKPDTNHVLAAAVTLLMNADTLKILKTLGTTPP